MWDHLPRETVDLSIECGSCGHIAGGYALGELMVEQGWRAHSTCSCIDPRRPLFTWRGDPTWWSCTYCDGRVRPKTAEELIVPDTPRRLPTPETLSRALRNPARTPTCVVCWQEREDVDNGVCSGCRETLGKRATTLAIENAKLREENAALIRLLANATDPENEGDWQEAREVGWRYVRERCDA
jgi:hypothetical protein